VEDVGEEEAYLLCFSFELSSSVITEGFCDRIDCVYQAPTLDVVRSFCTNFPLVHNFSVDSVQISDLVAEVIVQLHKV